MNITFRQLRIFLTLAEYKSVTAVAKILHVTQPTVSMQLKELTDTIGIPLYEIVSKKLYLTPAGQELASTARAMVDEWVSFEQYVDGLKGFTRGQLKVSVVSTAKYFVPAFIGSFCEKYPDIDIRFEVLNRDGVVQRLENNLDDLYIMSRPPAHIEIEDEVFMSNPLVLIAAKNHPLTKKKNIKLEDIKKERFIFREQGSGTRLVMDAHFKKYKFKPNLRLELGTNEAVRNCVAANLGISVLSAHALSSDPSTSGITVLRCESFPIQSSWHIVSPKGKKLSTIAQIFRQHLKSHMHTSSLNK